MNKTPENREDATRPPRSAGNAEVAMIAAIGPNLELGSHGELIWHISADLKNFKRLTTGHPVIMGRKTWESLPKRPLPGRLNIVMTRRGGNFAGAETAQSAEEALKKCEGMPAPFIMGGEEIYRLFMPLATTLYLTHIEATTDKEVDAWWPEFRQDWKLAECGRPEEDPTGIKYRFERWTRI